MKSHFDGLQLAGAVVWVLIWPVPAAIVFLAMLAWSFVQ